MKKLLAIILTVLMTFCAVPAFAKTSDKISVDAFDEKLWSGEGVTIARRTSSGSPILYFSFGDVSTASFSALIPPVDLTGTNQLELTLVVRGSSDEYTVTVSGGSAGNMGEASVYTDNFSSTQTVYIPLTPNIKTALDTISITITAEKGQLSYAMLTEVSATNNFSYKYRESFMADDIIATVGKIEKEEDGISLFPEKGNAAVSPSLIIDTSKDQAYTVWLSLRGVSSGSISIRATKTVRVKNDHNIGILNKEETKKEDVPVSGTQAMIAGNHSYAFTVKGAFDHIEFNFNDISTDGENRIVLIYGGGAFPAGEYNTSTIGTVNSCIYEKNTVKLTGTISSEVAAKYVNSKLGIFAIPASNTVDISKLKESVSTSAFSTKFTISCTAKDNYAEYKYLAAIITNDSVIPIGTPLFATAVQHVTLNNAANVTALDASDAASIFETGISSAIVDIYINRLFAADDAVYSATLRTFGGNYYYFDPEYISEVENRLLFAASAGINVYARLCTDNEKNFSFDPVDKDATLAMCAAAELISERFSTVHGYIFGDSLNNNISNYSSQSYAKSTASSISIFASCLKYSDTVELFLPFDYDSNIDAGAAFFTLRHALSLCSTMRCSLLYTTGNTDPMVCTSALSRVFSAASAYGYSMGNSAIIWQAPKECQKHEIIESYTLLCTNAIGSKMSFAAMNTHQVEDTDGLLDSLKRTVNDKSIFSSTTSWYRAIPESIEFTGNATLWDFTNAYDTKGFVAGGGFNNVITDKSILFSTRVMKCTDKTDVGGAGIVICRPNSPIDMSNCFLQINLGVVSDLAVDTDLSEITVIIGSGSARAEFSAAVEYNKPTKLLCYMAPFTGASSVDYAAIILSNDRGATLEVSDINLCSTVVPSEELDERITNTKETNPWLYMVIIAIAVFTATAFAILMRKKRENKQ